jgi:AAA15 family ATPase/GTPase
MNIFKLLILALCLWSCNENQEAKTVNQNIISEKQAIPDSNIALQFINDYTKFCISADKTKMTDTSWVQQNSLLSENFKKRYKDILDSAWHADKELGLGFDPIFDAQDFPEKGFLISKTETHEGYVSLVGIDWKDFEVVLKLELIDNKWLIDGAGIINIPNAKRAAR